MRQIVLASRPNGPPTPENFRLEEAADARARSGGLLLRGALFVTRPLLRKVTAWMINPVQALLALSEARRGGGGKNGG